MSASEHLVESARVEIDAPASLVWEVLLDLPRDGEWNSFDPRIESTLRLGDPVHVEARIAGTGRSVRVSEILVAIEPERRLAWEMRPTPGNPDAGRR